MIQKWSKDVFDFAAEALDMLPAEPLDELKGVRIPFTDSDGERREVLLFDTAGRLVYYDLSFYTVDMFKNQDRQSFRQYGGTRYTWQQTIILEAYNRAINTFDRDAYDAVQRWISVLSGHGIGKTATMCTVALHFLTCFFGAQIGMTSNTEQQVKDIFMKEFYVWKAKMRKEIADNLVQTDDHIRVRDTEDWFLRAQVARPEKPEALAGLHGPYVLVLVDEASGIANNVFETMQGSLTGRNYIVMYYSNGTRTEGEFFDSQKATAPFVKLSFNSEESPIVEEGYCERWLEKCMGNRDADEYRIRVRGKFASTAEMDDKGWIPLFANVPILFEPVRSQIIRRPIIGVDPAGQGRDRSIVHVRDTIYLKEVLNEKTSNEKDLARKIETIRDVYGTASSDIGVEAFGIGAKVVANIQTKVGESVNAILTDKPREEVKEKYHTYRSELGWKFREWLVAGGIIITNNPDAWKKELEKMKYKRDKQGRIMIMDKVTFKKEYAFSPDRFDAACMTFFRDEPTVKVVMTKEDLEAIENQKFLQQAQPQRKSGDPFSSM